MRDLKLSDFTYELPGDRVAEFPLENRDRSRLLVYRDEEISHRMFHQLPEILPDNCTLFFNNTRVMPARLIFHKATGARIEVFLLEPVAPSRDVASAMAVTGNCTWKCMIGNLKKWKDEDLILRIPHEKSELELTASLEDRTQALVRFSWDTGRSFSGVVHDAGKLPLPPYIKREPEESDYERYQTVYARLDGAVAAPTAGLHFTDNVLGQLSNKGVKMNELTLHVGAGTFQPVKAENVSTHRMHAEEIVIKRENITALLDAEMRIAVGTTSMRTMESLFWYGVRLFHNGPAEFIVGQNDPYELKAVSMEESLMAVVHEMDRQKTDYLTGRTEIFIFPGYTFRVCDGLITNFHLPGSTLILLVAAFTGEDWRKIYEEALSNDYRFLSYGDSSLLLPRR